MKNIKKALDGLPGYRELNACDNCKYIHYNGPENLTCFIDYGLNGEEYKIQHGFVCDRWEKG